MVPAAFSCPNMRRSVAGPLFDVCTGTCAHKFDARAPDMYATVRTCLTRRMSHVASRIRLARRMSRTASRARLRAMCLTPVVRTGV